MENQRFCKRCLMKDMPQMEYFQSLYEYIENIDEELKVTTEQYEERLDLCKECDQLVNGLCRICGCFVELRAVMKKNYCPGSEEKW